MKVKCAWCGRTDVSLTKKGGLSPHLGPGGVRCVGSGMTPHPDFRPEHGGKKEALK